MEPRKLDIHIKRGLYKFRTTFDPLKKNSPPTIYPPENLPRHANKSDSRMAQVQTFLTHAKEITPT